MESTFIAALVVFALVIAGMAVGVFFRRPPLSGSCGGLNNIFSEDGTATCEVCGATSEDRCQRKSSP